MVIVSTEKCNTNLSQGFEVLYFPINHTASAKPDLLLFRFSLVLFLRFCILLVHSYYFMCSTLTTVLGLSIFYQAVQL